jgi:hypothetical protein
MRRFLHLFAALLFILAALFTFPATVLAGEGDDLHGLEVDVNGYHVVLSSHDEWQRGENVIVVTITDSMGMPVEQADVEITVAPISKGHAEPEEDSHDVGPGHGSMTGTEPDEEEHETSGASEHEKEMPTMLAVQEGHEPGSYEAEVHLVSSGEYDVEVLFHVNGEMLQADFRVDVPGAGAQTLVLWSFLLVNTLVITSAGVMRKQSQTVKGMN